MLRATVLAGLLAASAHGHAGHTHGAGGHGQGHGHAHGHAALPPVPSVNPLAPAAQRFALSAVTIEPGSRFATQQDRVAQYMLSLNATRLTCLFTSAANLTGTFAAPTCEPYDHPQYFGHYAGHYLSAAALYIENVGSTARGPAMQARVDELLATLSAVQAAWGASSPAAPGYIFPYSLASWDALAQGRNCEPVCVPWYVYHKMLAGLLDLATRTGNAQALAMAKGMGTWAAGWSAGVLAAGGQAAWQAVLNIEWGGMNDALLNLYRVTGDATYLQAASLFNHWAWTAPLAAGVDSLGGFHANTHIPEGEAARASTV